MLHQVKVVAILMIVQGTLTTLMGILYLLTGPLLWLVQPILGGSQGPLGEPAFLTFATIFYAVMGIPILVAGILNLVAGVRSLYWRGRTLAIVALFTNLIPLITIYCAPSGLGLMIYGLIVFFNDEVARAFARAEDGELPEQDEREVRRRRRLWDEDDY